MWAEVLAWAEVDRIGPATPAIEADALNALPSKVLV